MSSPRTPRRARRAALIISTVCAGFCLAAPSAFAAPAVKTATGWKTPTEAWGVNDNLLAWNLDNAALAPRLAAIKKLNARWVRYSINWARIQEAGRGTFRWAEADSMVLRLAANGVRWRPLLLDVPQWLKAYPEVDLRQPATSSAPVAEFLDAFLARYGSRGTIWKLNPTVPATPVLDVELHNEPNAAYWWGFDPATWSLRTDYTGKGWAKLYGPAVDTVKAKHSSARFWMGGLIPQPSSTGVPAVTFMRNAFAAHPTLRTTLAGVALHSYPYSGSPTRLSDPLQAQYSVMYAVHAMRTYGRSTMKLQFNEFGASLLNVPDAANRTAIMEQIADLARSDCPIEGFAPHTSIDWEDDTNNPERWYGLVSRTTGALYSHAAAYASKVAAYNAGKVKGALIDAC